MECLERDSVSQSGHDSRKRRHILHQRGGNPYPHMDVERCQRFRRYGNRQGHTVIVGSRQRIQPVRNNTDRVTATSNGRSAACTVRQSAGSQTTEYGNWTTGSLSVSASPSGIGSSGGTSRLSATASQSRPKYTKWNGITTGTTTEYRSVDVSSSASWSGSASGFSRSGTTVTVAANGSTSSRNCTYTASYGGKSGHVTIHQDGKPADVITYGYIFTLGAVSGDDVVSTGGTVTYSVTSQKITYTNGSETSRSNIGWSASANVSWISAGTNSATVSENPTTSDRSGTITLTQNESGRKLSITVYQDRKVSVDIN